MTTALETLTNNLADRFGIQSQNATELMNVLKSTAFKSKETVSDAQMTTLEVIARHVKISNSGCWEWTGALSKGYGQLTNKGKHYTAHRFSFENLVGPISNGLWVLHHCDNRPCVNPNHLYQGTPINNRADMLNRKRWSHPWGNRTHCESGHIYEQGSFRICKSDGSRVCKTCHREYMRTYRATKKGVSA